MSDLDDLASASRTGKARDPRVIPAYMPPSKRGFGPIIWIALALGIILAGVIVLFFVRLGSAPSVVPTATPAPAPAIAPPPQTKPVSRVPAGREALQDIADPYQALDIYHLKRIQGTNTIEIKIRNKSKRGLLVKSVELFAEKSDRKPLDNIGFWIGPGEAIVQQREVLELSRRLGEDEPMKAVINEIEFRDEPPTDVVDQPPGTSTRDNSNR